MSSPTLGKDESRSGSIIFPFKLDDLPAYRTAFNSRLICINGLIQGNKKKANPNFDKMNLTPGTFFMDRLKNAICSFVYQRLSQSQKYRYVKFYVSGL